MKKFFTLLFLLLVVGLGLLFFIPGPEGEPYLTVDDLRSGEIGLTEILRSESEEVEQPEAPIQTTVYRYRDELGNWQYSSHPVDGTDAEEVHIDTTATFSTDFDSGAADSSVGRQAPADQYRGLPHAESGHRAMEKARDVQMQMEERNKQLEQSLQQ